MLKYSSQGENIMEVRYEDKKCDNCAHCNKILGPLNYICENKYSENYKQKVKPKDRCNRFREYTYCLKCANFNKDAKICRNKKSIYYNRYGVILPRFGCEHKYDAGYVASTISDILHLDKKKSYSIFLGKLKQELLKINADYKESIKFYNEMCYFFGTALDYDQNRVKRAQELKTEYLDNVWEYMRDENYVEAYNKFWDMLIEMNKDYQIVDNSKLLTLSSRK